jgi:ribonucleoside-diphosphate reductase alpha chain
MLEEKKAWALIEQGYDGSFNGEAYGSIMYQNENLSVRVSDDFMRRALAEDGDHDWQTFAVTTGLPIETKDARDLYSRMAEGAWTCGGSVTMCRDSNAQNCITPDNSVSSCNQGGGDCGGY